VLGALFQEVCSLIKTTTYVQSNMQA